MKADGRYSTPFDPRKTTMDQEAKKADDLEKARIAAVRAEKFGQNPIDFKFESDEATGKGIQNPSGEVSVNVVSNERRLGSLEASDDLSVVQECLVGAFLLLLMFMVYLFTRRFTAPKASTTMRIVRKKAPIVHKLL